MRNVRGECSPKRTIEDMSEESAIETNVTGFLELESMASMHRLGESATAFFDGGSTLVDLDGQASNEAREAADAHREELSHGHHLSERYNVQSEIARGGMGAVLEVHDNDLDRRVAMKVLLRDTRRSETDSGASLDTGPVDRFIAEAQLTGWLEHPNIVPVHELGLDSEGRVYFTMKRVKGRSLRQVMDKLRQGHAATLAEFPPTKLLTILLKICDAIEFAHNRHIVHRDLKPENIMVGQFGEVLVMDWGLAKQIETKIGDKVESLPGNETPYFKLDVSLGATDSDSRNTREGTVSGTPAYMAPEQARGNIEQITRRTDVFCLGGLLYEMLCLVPPYLAEKMTVALDMARDHELLPPKAKLDRILKHDRLKRAFGATGIERARKHPRELVSVAMKAMSEKKECRYRTVAKFKKDIENYLGAMPVSAHRDSPWTALSKWARRNPTTATVSTVMFVFILMGAVVFAGFRAKLEMERAESAHAKADYEADQKSKAQKLLNTEAELRVKSENAKAIEKEALEQERKRAESLDIRNSAFVPFSEASDLVARSASMADWTERERLWRRAASLFGNALTLDNSFVEAHIGLANVYADLGFEDDALSHYARADQLTADRTGRGNVEALMAFAMYDFQRKVLREGLSGNFDEVFRRFEPVAQAAEPGSHFAKIAEVLIGLGEEYRTATAIEFLKAQNKAAATLSEIESTGLPLWEVYTLMAVLDNGLGMDNRIARRDYLRRARELKPNLPILTWLEIKNSGRTHSKIDRIALRLWDKYITQFPYDPRGYYSRAASRFNSEKSRDARFEVADLTSAINRNPRYADAHKLLLRILVREGRNADAHAHIQRMRLSASGLTTSEITLIDAELTASTGQYEKMRKRVVDAMHEPSTDGSRAFTTAANVLLRDSDFQSLFDFTVQIGEALQTDAPPLVLLYQARALTMLGRFAESDSVFAELLADPQLLPRDYRPVLRNWSDDAREYPRLMGRNTTLPPRQRFDLARILATIGADPVRWLPYFKTGGLAHHEQLTLVHPGDKILRAIGEARLAEQYQDIKARSKRILAIIIIKQAFEEGYLNRRRILSNEFLAPLVTDSELAGIFDVR